ncbi:arp2/3 complex-activating protein rickA-like isoform X2 [Vanessa atalanta]|nr:arp2/3 complex-activating protein rickA-like isoform X2 [Vanessa atalanta]
MLRFRGFRASLNFTSGKGSGIDYHYDTSPGVSLNGAYRSNKDELIDNFTNPEPPKRITPSMVKLPQSQSGPAIKPSKSTSNLLRPPNVSANVRNSSSDIPQTSNNNTQLTKSQIKEQQKLEKRRLAEQKKRDKLAAKEQQKMEKLRKEREKQEQKARAAQQNSKVKKRSAPQPQIAVPPNPPIPPNPPAPPNPPVPPPVPSHPQILATYSTNTLESSISRSSGPPPYTAEVTSIQRHNKGDINFSKPVQDSGSWDMISQHRQQLNRPTGVSKSMPKQTHLDLHYNAGTSKTTQENSDA